MSEYAAVSSSSYDIDSLVAKLNERAAAGWEVVSVVSTGGEVSAILRRDGGAVSAAPAEAAPVAVEEPAPAPAPEPEPAPEPVSTWAPEPEPEPAPVVTPPVIDTPVIAAVEEPAGWGAVAEVAPEPAPEPTPVSPIEVSAPAASPVQAASSTPAGWYPDPSGRYEVRYWDGLQWTEHVSRQGQQFTDPPVA